MKSALNGLLVLSLGLSFSLALAEGRIPEMSHDGLVLQADTEADLVYVQPGSDLGVYDNVMLIKPHIAFKKNWQRDQNRTRFGEDRVTDKDMERIVSQTKDLFGQVFFDVLEENGYPVVSVPAADVLLVRPAIIDLDIAAPEVDSTGRTTTYTAEGDEATLFIELFDSVTGQILLRATDTEKGGRKDLGWALMRTRGNNSDDAKKAFRIWADLLVNALDEARKNNSG